MKWPHYECRLWRNIMKRLFTLALGAFLLFYQPLYAQDTAGDKAREAANKTFDKGKEIYGQLFPTQTIKSQNKTYYNAFCDSQSGIHNKKPLCKILKVRKKTLLASPKVETSPIGIIFNAILYRQGNANIPAKEASKNIKNIKRLTKAKKMDLNFFIAGVFQWFYDCNKQVCYRPKNFNPYMSQLVHYVINNGNNEEVKAAKYVKKVLALK